MMPSGEQNRCDSQASDVSTWSDYRLQWLFDPNRYDHLPIEEQLQRFAHRDLRKVKIYKIAMQIWGKPMKRKRTIIAPPMYDSISPVHIKPVKLAPLVTTELNPQVPHPALPTDKEVVAQKEKEKLDAYNQWLHDRKAFRKSLQNMGLNDDWLQRKTDKTALEKRVLKKIIRDRLPKADIPPPQIGRTIEAILPDESPVVKGPSPLAIRIIEQFLHEKKLRLLDLFTYVDRNKNWKLTRDEFRQAMVKAKIPISEVLLEDLILTLDTDLNNELDYRELAKGMGLWKIEKRESKRKLVSSNALTSSPSKYSQMCGFEFPEQHSSLSTTLSLPQSGVRAVELMQNARDNTIPNIRTTSPTRVKSALSNISSTSSYLEPPPLDLRPEQRLASSDEAMVDLRKRDREALNRLYRKSCSPSIRDTSDEANMKTVIKTGDKAVDDHSRPSTLCGPMADMVDKFRELKLKEFNEIIDLCSSNNVVLTEDLLSKVLLYPADNVHTHIKKAISQPQEKLISSTFADPPKRPKTPVPEQTTAYAKRSKTGRIMVDSRQAYPSKQRVAAVPTKMYLSTGKALVRRQVDCWMSFEEYEAMTRHMATRYAQLNTKVDGNVFWPGQLLKKMRLCMPDTEPKSESVFQSVKREKPIYPGYNNDLANWTINDSGYFQEGIMDTYKNKHI